ncbi:cleavage stimulating factor 64 isoform X2 [Cornus florida]|uniref:cleavage stimulating factor 64 isoform X2 n=1 Tax=Cornus florida TaxID=4283 RepID=UPI0028A1CD38|nr:cleavage stimulating factor 64 isoform X2 [Cornus florida]
MASSQHRCVFVGNIPYDATEEQLVQICEEVGPVVSFRLVIDRETGKPKGYGFCEYKDEETALSARRNLQGYEINGRQLRVDFAENDKGTDRNRDQGRGGPGMVANVDPQKQSGSAAIVGDSGFYQPLGLQLAMTAASVMAGALGGAQIGSKSNQNGLQNQLALGTDPLTLHLAKMSRNQLNEIMSELKVMATQNRELARQLLLASPHLSKALFQALIMLGMVTPQMLQMPNIRQAPGPLTQTSLQDGQPGQRPAVETLPGLPPFAQDKLHFGLMPKVQEGQVPSMPTNSLVHSHYPALQQLQTQPQIQLPHQAQKQVLEQATLRGQTGVSTLPSIHMQPLSNLSVKPQIQVAASSFMKKHMQPPVLQQTGQVGAASLGHNTQLVAPNATLQPSNFMRPPLSDKGFQPGSSILSGIPDTINKFGDIPAQVAKSSIQAQRDDIYLSLPSVSSQKASTVHDTADPTNHPSKLVKLDDGRSTSFPAAGLNVSSLSGPSQVSGRFSSGNQIPKAEEAQNSDKQVPQLLLRPEVESVLLQQVLNLTPEQLSSLPPDQQQQVIQLQQMLR